MRFASETFLEIMTVIVTEKPSVARDLAQFLNTRSRKEGYFEGAG